MSLPSEVPVPTVRQLRTAREIVSLEQSYVSRDKEAVLQQRWAIRLLGTINVLILLVGALSGIALAVALAQDLQWAQGAPDRVEGLRQALTILGLVIAACGIGATVLGQVARESDRLGRWRSLRSEAELLRGQKFATLARLAAAAGPGPAHEVLDVVRQDLLEDQQAYYERRAREHRESAGVTSVWSGVGLALSALAGATAVAVVMEFPIQWLLVLGVIAAAVSAFATDRENLRRDRSNAELYERTASRLAALGSGVDRVDAEISSGNPQAVVAFTDLVVEELQAEHRRWVEVLSITQEQLDRLDDRLREARSRSELELSRSAEAKPATEASIEASTEATTEGKMGTTQTAPGEIAPAVSSDNISTDLARWRSVLVTAANVLPVAEAERARQLATEVSRILGQLDSSAPASSSIAAAASLASALRAENPLGMWLTQVLPSVTPLLGAAVPPVSLLLGLASVGAKLGEEAYRRWVARVLQTPFTPGLIDPGALTSTMVLAAMEASPEFSAAWRAEREGGNLEAIGDVGRLLVDDPEQLWTQASARFGNDRAAFDRGVRAMRNILLDRTLEVDTAEIGRAELPESTTVPELLDSVGKLQSNSEGRAVLFTAVQLVHELRNQGVADPVAALRATLLAKVLP